MNCKQDGETIDHPMYTVNENKHDSEDATAGKQDFPYSSKGGDKADAARRKFVIVSELQTAIMPGMQLVTPSTGWPRKPDGSARSECGRDMAL